MDSSPPNHGAPRRGYDTHNDPRDADPPSEQPDSQPPGASQSHGTSNQAFFGGVSPARSALSTPRSDVRRRGPGRPASVDENANDGGPALPEGVGLIWGTTVGVDECRKQFRAFFMTYTDGDSDEPAHIRKFQEMGVTGDYGVNIDCTLLHAFDPELYRNLVSYPQEVIPLMDDIIKKEYLRFFPDDQNKADLIRARPFNLRRVRHMRDLNPTEIDMLVSIRGMVSRASAIIPDIKTAFFTCAVCKHETEERLDRGRIEEPYTCKNDHCKAKFSYQLMHNRCQFADKQIVKLQETPESIPEGETPQTVNLCAFDELVDVARPGDRIQVTGIYRAVPIRLKPNQRTLSSIYKTYIDIVHFQKVDKKKSSGAAQDSGSVKNTNSEEYDESGGFTEQEESRLWEIAQKPDIYNLLTRSLAPSIWEMEDVKKGILCQLFGGTSKELTSFKGKYRGEINILLVGDPGVSKSQLLSFVHKISPRGVYTSGKGSSAVGLTAYITRDPDSRELVLESGALVLSDRGICCIDEFDKMSDNARSVLHEAMEQQTVSVAKAGIICNLNAKTSVLAAANPVESRYNTQKTVVENIQLPPTLLSRFDLIYLLIDKADETNDARLARHMVSLFSNKDFRANKNQLETIPIETLTRYIAYARHKISPTITDEAAAKLVEGYCEARQMSKDPNVISATPRQLESTIRLAEAHARIRFSAKVEECDVEEALRLVRVSTQRAAVNPETGIIDMGALTTGMSAAMRKKIEQLSQAVRDFLAEKDGLVNFLDVFDAISKGSSEALKEQELVRVVTQLESDGVLFISGKGNPKTMVLKRVL